MIVVWRVTEKCNLACGFCAYDRRLARDRHESDPAQIRRFAAVLGDYQTATGDRVLVSWIGGEPLRWAPLTALSRDLPCETGLALSTTTNGTPLESAATRRHLLEHYSELTVSVDALGEAHDRLRGSPGLFARVKQHVTALVAEGRERPRRLKLRANVVLLRDTIGHFAALARELAGWGFDEITFNGLGGRDRPEFFIGQSLRPAQVEAFMAQLPRLRSELHDRGVTVGGGPAYLERLHASASGTILPVTNCAPGESFLFIDQQGRIAPCSFTTDTYGLSIDELRTAADVRELPRIFSRKRRERQAAVCGDCPSTHVFSKFAPVA